MAKKQKTTPKPRPAAPVPQHVFKVGDAVRTNARYRQLISATARVGTAVDCIDPDTYRVRLDGFLKPQGVHGSFLEPSGSKKGPRQ